MVTDEPRDRLNAFASCPAATGEADCPQFPDGAHRCGLERRHEKDEDLKPITERLAHRCTCGDYVWTSLSGTLTDQTVIPGQAEMVISSKVVAREAGRQMLEAIEAFNRGGGGLNLP